MRKVRYYKCPVCGYKLKTLNGWVEHMNNVHPGSIPDNMSPTQYFNFLITGKSSHPCIICGKPTEWNEKSLKYNRYCNDPACKAQAAKIAKQNMMRKYQKEHLLDDPDMQKKMLKGRKISGVYEFKDGGKIDYVGTYEKDFLEMMDDFLQWPSVDIEFPSPHVYKYEYEGKERFYIPDGYIGSLNLEIEIKQNTSTHHKIIAVDKEKEKLKDAAMHSLRDKVNYIKVVDKDYKPFFEKVMELKDSYEDPGHKTKKDIPYDLLDESDKSNKQGLQEKDITMFICALQKTLAMYDYGFKIQGKKALLTPENFHNYYKTLEPNKFQNQKCGICYDFTHFQYTALMAAMIDSQCIYVEVKDKHNKDNIQTHTFTVVPWRNQWIYMESSFGKLMGVYLANNVNDIVSTVVANMIEDHTFEEPVCDGYYVYKPDKSYYGISGGMFMDKIKYYIKKHPIYSLKAVALDKISK